MKNKIQIIQGDCREQLRSLPANSVHCCITSPPYYSLRDYGTAQWSGGNPYCAHTGSARRYTEQSAARAGGEAFSVAGPDNATRLKQARWREGGVCTKCGAVHFDAQIGLEPTPAAYVAELVSIFRELRRVLRDDGIVWLNLGDSYSSGPRGSTTDQSKNVGAASIAQGLRRPPSQLGSGVKPKDVIGIPWRVAFALQDDGWFLRQDIIWAKPNPMPESVTDRCTRSHEYVFLLSKSEHYYYDAAAIAEPGQDWHSPGEKSIDRAADSRPLGNKAGNAGLRVAGAREANTRNKRSVWNVSVQPFNGAHFATFPPKLIEPMVLAGTSNKCCKRCGAPWQRQVEHRPEPNADQPRGKSGLLDATGTHHGQNSRRGVRGSSFDNNPRRRPPPPPTLGWQASCKCHASTVPCTVLDPFAGAGTVGMVAERFQRDAILIDLNTQYVKLAWQRLRDDAGLLRHGTPA